MLKLIVFDCDGVLFDSRLANREYYNHLLHYYNHPPMDESELEYAHMHNAADSIRYIFRHYPEDDLMEIDAYRRKLGYDPRTPISEGIPRFVDWYKEYHRAGG